MQFLSDSDPVRTTMRQYYEWAHTVKGRIDLVGMHETLQEEIMQKLTYMYKKRDFYLSYSLEWCQAAPFVDPLVGFRYQ